MKGAYLEPTFAYVLVCAANWLWWREDPGFLSVRLHPYLFLTLLFAVRYGVREGALSGVLGAGLVIAGYFHRDEGLLMDWLFNFDSLGLPLTLVLVGVLVGEASQSRLKRAAWLRAALDEEAAAHVKLGQSHKELSAALLQLERRMADQGLGTQDFSQALLDLQEVRAHPELYDRVQELMQKFLQVDRSVILIFGSDAHSQEPYSRDRQLPSDEELAALMASPAYSEALYTKKTTALAEFLDEEIVSNAAQASLFFCGPILGGGDRVAAMVLVYAIPFIHYNITHFRLFEVILKAAGQGARRIEEVDRLRHSAPYHEIYLVEREDYFLKNLEIQAGAGGDHEVLLAGYRFSNLVREEQRERFRILLSQLCLIQGVRAGYLEGADCFACHGSAESLEKLEIPERFASYGFPPTLAEVVTCRLEFGSELQRRERTRGLDLLKRTFAAAHAAPHPPGL